MAGDWIKMRGNLWDDPRVAKLCDLTDCGEAQIVGGLYWLWATADQHTEDGIMPGLTLRQIDRKTGIQGFGQALCEIGWLADHPEGVRIVKFEEHNGTSAKRRCSEAQRKANSRNTSASDADITRTESGQDAELEKEKRREEKKEPKSKANTPAAPKYSALDDLVSHGVDRQIASDWLVVRKGKKAPPTKTAIDGVLRELAKAGLSAADGIRLCCERAWAGFNPEWIAPKPDARASPAFQTKHEQTRDFLNELTGNHHDQRSPSADIIDVDARTIAD